MRPLSEARIDSPKVQTLSLMALISILTAILWGSAKLACNSKVASARKPLELTTIERSKDPKSAAFEFQQLMARHEYKMARTIATGRAIEQVGEAEKQCAADRAACDRERIQLKDTVKSSAALLSSTPRQAKVRVVTQGLPTGKQTYVVDVVPQGDGWKVADRRPGDD